MEVSQKRIFALALRDVLLSASSTDQKTTTCTTTRPTVFLRRLAGIYRGDIAASVSVENEDHGAFGRWSKPNLTSIEW